MMCFARVATMVPAVLLCAGAVSAQTPTPGAVPEESPFYVEFNVGATFGHVSDKSVGAEAGMRVMKGLDVFLEGGHIGNAATTDFELRGQKIATAVGATLSAVEKVNYFDLGVRYHIVATPMVRPYVAFGVGVAQAQTETNFSVNGTAATPESLGVQVGTDLAGTSRRGFVMFGFGANVVFATRYFADVSYRFGRVAGQTLDTEVILAPIPTQRLQLGVGIRF